MRSVLALLALIACKGEPGPTGDDDDALTETDLPTEPGISAVCSADPSGNTLRFRCDVLLQPPGPVDLTFEPSDGSRPARVHSGEGQVWMYFMAEQTDYNWTLTSQADPTMKATGTVKTGLPPEEARVFATPTGTSTASMFLTSSPCSGAYILALDPDGTLLWYQDIAQQGVIPPLLDVVTYTEDETVMAMASAYVVEVDWTGTELLVMTPGFDNGTEIHHDVFRRDGHTFTLFQETMDLGGDNTQLDGFYIHDAAGELVATWKLIDHFTPPIPPVGIGGFVDYSHANSLFVQEDGDIMISFRHMSAVAKIRGDWTAPDFGEILWRLSGDAAFTDFGSDFSLTASMGSYPGFVYQHNAHPLPDGRLALLDNRKSQYERTRVLVIDLDEQAGTANVDLAYELDRLCFIQGSAWHTAAGNPVATCANDGILFEFAENIVAEPVYELSTSCATGPSHYTPRFVPLSL